MITCICCRQPYKEGVPLATVEGGMQGVCRECWGKMTPAEQGNLQVQAWQMLSASALNQTLGETRVQIELFREFIERICKEAEERGGDSYFPFSSRN